MRSDTLFSSCRAVVFNVASARRGFPATAVSPTGKPAKSGATACVRAALWPAPDPRLAGENAPAGCLSHGREAQTVFWLAPRSCEKTVRSKRRDRERTAERRVRAASCRRFIAAPAHRRAGPRRAIRRYALGRSCSDGMLPPQRAAIRRARRSSTEIATIPSSLQAELQRSSSDTLARGPQVGAIDAVDSDNSADWISVKRTSPIRRARSLRRSPES